MGSNPTPSAKLIIRISPETHGSTKLGRLVCHPTEVGQIPISCPKTNSFVGQFVFELKHLISQGIAIAPTDMVGMGVQVLNPFPKLGIKF